MNKNRTAMILAGGKSSRMGRNKSFVALRDTPLIEIVIRNLSVEFDEIMICTDKPHLYREYDVQVRPDLYSYRGPLNGVYTGLLASGSDCNFVTACDMPFLEKGLLRYMLDRSSGYDLVIPEYGGRLQPLFAVYSRRCADVIGDCLKMEHLKITDMAAKVRTHIVKENKVKSFDPCGRSFININTKEELKCVQLSI